MRPTSTTLLRKIQLSTVTLLLASAAMYADNAHAARCASQPAAISRPATAGIDQQLARLAQLLKLQPSQQPAWQAFAKAQQAAHSLREPLSENASIVEITAEQADFAAIMAVRMEVISQTTRKLWATLSSEQRTTLERVMQRQMMLAGPGAGPRPPRGGAMD